MRLLIRLDQITVNDRICGVDRHKCSEGEEIEAGKEDGNRYIKGKQKQNKEKIKSDQKDDSKGCEEISLDPQNRENKRVLENLGPLHLERDHKLIDIKSHQEIDHSYRKNNTEHNVVKACRSTAVKRNVIYSEECNYYEIKRSESERLLPILSNTVKVIGKDKDRVTAEEAAQNVCGADVLKSPGKEQENTQADQNVGACYGQYGKPDLEINGIQNGSDRRRIRDHGRAVYGSVERGGYRGSVRGQDIEKNARNDWDDHEEHHEIECYKSSSLAPKKLEEEFEGRSSVFCLGDLLFRSTETLEKIEFFIVFQVFSSLKNFINRYLNVRCLPSRQRAGPKE